MKWEKQGLIFAPNKSLWWQQHYGILPTPIHLKEKKVIRIYFSTTCKENFGRITFIDVDENNPSIIISNLERISLDIGEHGAFDDCGVTPSAILFEDNKYILYYFGYQRHYRTPYSIFSGLAYSTDGINFERYKKTPILERTNTELSLRSNPGVIKDGDIYKMIYISDFGWRKITSKIFDNKLLPTYCLKYAESADGINWNINQQPILIPEGDEFGFGRPYLLKKKNKYYLYYSVRRKNISYRIGYATSDDGINWQRKDEEIGIDVSENGWDSEMVCYPAVIEVNGKTYLFYNGNQNGKTGFGYANLVEK